MITLQAMAKTGGPQLEEEHDRIITLINQGIYHPSDQKYINLLISLEKVHQLLLNYKTMEQEGL